MSSTERVYLGTVAFVEPSDRCHYAHAAVLVPDEDAAPSTADVGAAVTVSLCGDWEHEGPCRWPSNHDTVAAADCWSYRVLFVAPRADEAAVRERIEEALRSDHRWRVLESGPRNVAASEQALADRLAATPVRR